MPASFAYSVAVAGIQNGYIQQHNDPDRQKIISVSVINGTLVPLIWKINMYETGIIR